MVAIRDDSPFAVEIGGVIRQLTQRDEPCAGDMADLPLMRLTYIDEQEVRIGSHLAGQLGCRDLGSILPAVRACVRAAKGLVIDQLGNRGLLSANRTVRILAQLEFPNVERESVQQNQSADQRLTDAEDQLHRLERLNTSHDSGQHAENASFGAGGNQTGRRRLAKEASVTWALFSIEHRRLSLEAEDGAIGVGLSQQNAGVVDQIPGWEIVRAVHDDIEITQYLQCVVRGEAGVEPLDLRVGIEVVDPRLGRIELRRADGARAVDDLTLQIGHFDGVEVDQSQRSNACRGQIQRCRGAETPGSHEYDTGGFQAALSFEAYLRQDEMAGVPQDFLLRQLRQLGPDGRHSSSNAGYDREFISIGCRGVTFTHVPNVSVVEKQVHETAYRSVIFK